MLQQLKIALSKPNTRLYAKVDEDDRRKEVSLSALTRPYDGAGAQSSAVVATVRPRGSQAAKEAHYSTLAGVAQQPGDVRNQDRRCQSLRQVAVAPNLPCACAAMRA